MGKTVLHAFPIALTAVLITSCGTKEGDSPKLPPAPATVPFVATPFPSHDSGYGLVDAAERGLIEYSVTGNGGSSGDSLLLTIRRTGDQPLVVRVDAGTVFGPSDSAFQRMVAVGVQGIVVDPNSGGYHPISVIELDDDSFRTYVLEAYCMDFQLQNPTAAVAMTPMAIDVRAAQVLQAAKSTGLSVKATQVALWVDREHVTKEKIQASFTASDQEIEDAWQLLKQLPPP